MTKPINAVPRVRAALGILERLQAEIVATWPDLCDRPIEALDVSIGLELALTDLRRLQRHEAADLDKHLGASHAGATVTGR